MPEWPLAKTETPKCEDCYFRKKMLCALDLDEPCVTFRAEPARGSRAAEAAGAAAAAAALGRREPLTGARPRPALNLAAHVTAPTPRDGGSSHSLGR